MLVLRSPILQMTIILAAVVVDLLGYGLVVPLLPAVLDELLPAATQDAALIGLILAGYALLQAIGGPLLGALSDRIGRRPVLLLCLFGTSIGYTLLALATNVWMLVLALLVDAATGANLSVAQAAIADRSSATTRARNFGLVGVAFGLGVTLGPFLAGVLVPFGLRTPAMAAALLAWLNLVAAWVLLPETHPADQRQAALAFQPKHEALLPSGLWPVLAIMTLMNLAFVGLQSNFPLYSTRQFGWDVAQVAFFFGMVGVFAVFTQALLINLLRRFLSEQPLACLGAVMMAVGLLLFSLAPAGWMLYPTAVVAAIGSSLCIPTLTSLLSQRAGTLSQGRAMAAQQVAINIALVAGPLLAGVSAQWIAPQAPYLLGMACAWASAILLLRLRAEA
ncbi:MAG: tetracycline resistance MFS efflux pump [Roseiflexaceae bacterium]